MQHTQPQRFKLDRLLDRSGLRIGRISGAGRGVAAVAGLLMSSVVAGQSATQSDVNQPTSQPATSQPAAQSTTGTTPPTNPTPGTSRTIGLPYGPNFIRPGLTPPTMPYRDPQLNPRHTTDYVLPKEVSDWIAPPADWQLGVPVRYAGRLYYVVRDAEAYVAQFEAAYAAFLLPLPKEITGYDVDVVMDTRELASGTYGLRGAGLGTYRRGGGGAFGVWSPHRGNSVTIGDYTFSGPWEWPYGRQRFYGGGQAFSSPWFWYWQEWSPHRLEARDASRLGFSPVVEGHLVPGFVPVVPEPEPIRVLTPREQAVLAMTEGDAEGALLPMLDHLNSSSGDGDWAGRRLLALALLGARRPSDAASVMRLAYLGDPGLIEVPIETQVLAGLRVRRLAQEAGRHASAADSASGWFLMAVLLRAQGMDRRALEMLERAERWGLEDTIATPFRGSLAP